MRADITIGETGQFLDVLTQLLRAERAVEAEADRPDMAQRIVEGLGGLAGQRAAAGIGDGAGDHHRQTFAGGFEEGLDGVDRGLRIQRVEDSFDQKQIRAAVDQTLCGFGVGGDQFVEADIAKARIVHIRRDRCRAIGRAEHAGDEARFVRRLGLEFIRDGARELRGGLVQFVDDVFQVIIGLGHGGRIEGVGLDDIGAGVQVGAVNVADDLRLCQRQQVVVALQVGVMIREARAAVVGLFQLVTLDHGAHGTIQDQDAVFKCVFYGVHGRTVWQRINRRSLTCAPATRRRVGSLLPTRDVCGSGG